eukprot:TRINITY_DN56051_c0_g1_i1.p1 TRINITY_DN56051_c0_g1~~TRINITY_DN56051_c0_g1_i1.p1  ORF type:complete len:955 (-),score=189.30 TRINITY_DN56051_c0_g1_i1:43-2907(-)
MLRLEAQAGARAHLYPQPHTATSCCCLVSCLHARCGQLLAVSMATAASPPISAVMAAPWWGERVSEIAVDVERLDLEARRRLGISSCCDGAASLLAPCALWAFLALALPAVLLGLQMTFPQAAFWLQLAAISLASLGCLLGCCRCCCCGLRRTCCSGVFNVPDPAPLLPPLSKTSGLRSVPVRRVLLVYNPFAGKQHAEEILQQAVLPGLAKRGVQCRVIATEHRGHALEIARTTSLADVDAAVCLGGDGTYHEFVNGLLARPDGARLPVTLIPLGSGNGLAATLRQNMRRLGMEVSVWSELPEVVAWSLDRVAAGRAAAADLLEVEVSGRRLAAVMQVYLGLLGEVDIIAEPLRWLGPARLDLVAVWSILRKQSAGLRCHMKLADGTTSSLDLQAVGASVGLSQHYSDTIRAVPQAQLDDGLAEFSFSEAGATVDELLAGFLKLGSGAHLGDTEAWDWRQVTEMEIEFQGPGVCNIDGEILEHDGRLKFRVLPGAVDLLVNVEEWNLAGQPATTPWRSDPARWAMLGIFCLLSMSSQAIWIGFAPIQRETMEAFGVSQGWVNFLALVYMILYLPANFPASYAMDVYGCRFALSLGAAINLAGAVLRAALPAAPGTAAQLVMAGQVLCALAQPLFTDMPPKIASAWFPAHQRVLADTIASMAAPVGAAVGFVLPALGGLQNMLYIQLAWALVAAVIAWVCFRKAPRYPPSPAASRVHGSGSFRRELCAALQNGRLWCLIIAFSCGLGSFNCLSTLSAELTQPFGFSADDASLFGVLTVAFGIVGAAVMTGVVGITHRYKPVLMTCLSLCVVFATVATVSIVTIGSGPGGHLLMNLAFAGLGFAATPIMPVSFEAAVEVGHPTGEGTLAGLCMSGGQVLGIAQTLVVSRLVQAGNPKAAWLITGALFVAALLALIPFRTGGLRLVAESDAECTSEGAMQSPLLEESSSSSPSNND